MNARSTSRLPLFGATIALLWAATSGAPAEHRAPDDQRVSPPSARDSMPPGTVSALEFIRSQVPLAAPNRELSPRQMRVLQDLIESAPRTERVLSLQRRAEQIISAAGGSDLLRTSVGVQEQLDLISRELETDAAQAELLRVIESLFEPRQITRPDWSRLQRGDLLFVRHVSQPIQSFLWAMRFSHCGNYDGDGWVYEAVLGQGVIRRRLDEWKAFEGTIALARNVTTTPEEVERALNRAKERYGADGRTPYNFWFLDKETEDRLYCSQLSWKIHKAARIDLDSNDGRYLLWMSAKWGSWITRFVGVPAVAPDEVALSPHVQIYSEGPTP